MRRIIILGLTLSILLLACQKQPQQNSTQINPASPKTKLTSIDTLFLKQGIIKVYEPLKVLIGESDSAHAIYDISLRCIAKYHGKVCPGIATGFKMFQDIIDSLYPETHVAVRGQVAVTCSKPNDMLDVAGYIFGIRTKNCCGRSELGKGLLVVDTSLATGVPKQFVMIFKRLDNGKSYKVIFNKYKLMDKDQWPFIDSFLYKYEHGQPYTQQELHKFQQMVHTEVLNVLKNGPRPGVYTIERYK